MKELFIILSFCILTCCGDEEDNFLIDYNNNIDLWNGKNISHYQVEFDVSCFCYPETRGPWEIEVLNNKVIKINGEEVFDIEKGWPWIQTVDGLFLEITRLKDFNPWVLEVKYDETYGFPISMWYNQEENMMDEELGYYLSNFKILN